MTELHVMRVIVGLLVVGTIISAMWAIAAAISIGWWFLPTLAGAAAVIYSIGFATIRVMDGR